jgi:hypothetical protein
VGPLASLIGSELTALPQHERRTVLMITNVEQDQVQMPTPSLGGPETGYACCSPILRRFAGHFETSQARERCPEVKPCGRRIRFSLD